MPRRGIPKSVGAGAGPNAPPKVKPKRQQKKACGVARAVRGAATVERCGANDNERCKTSSNKSITYSPVKVVLKVIGPFTTSW